MFFLRLLIILRLIDCSQRPLYIDSDNPGQIVAKNIRFHSIQKSNFRQFNFSY